MHQALYRKWRPQTFDQVCGQEHITSILKYETEHGTLNHAYLFCGSRGTGKTTCAKILAKVINCEHPVNGSPCGQCESCRSIESGAATDVLEMDAASNNGVDNIRDIRDEVVYAPNALKYRVYIIDEVHMLSGSAFNALLKTLEEPPAHVVFILATTELQKLPATIISRCQRFDFRRIATPVLRDRLLYIAEKEGISLQSDAAVLLAKLAQGGMRDAISLLELCAGARKPITPDLVNETVGLTGRETILRTVRAIAKREYDVLYTEIAEIVRSSMDLSVFWQDLLSVFRDLMMCKTTRNFAGYLDLTDTEAEQLRELGALFSKEKISFCQRLLEQSYLAMQGANALKRITAEVTLTRLCDESLNTQPEAMLSRIARLEEQLYSGNWRSSGGIKDDGGGSATAPEPVSRVEKSGDVGDSEKEERVKCSGYSAITSDVDTQHGKRSTMVSDSTAGMQSPDKKRMLRPLKCWGEVVSRVSTQDAMAASFLSSAHAYLTPEETVLIRFDSDFHLMMLDRGNTKDILRGALSVCLQREIRESALICEKAPQTSEVSALDEILEDL